VMKQDEIPANNNIIHMFPYHDRKKDLSAIIIG